MGPHDFGRFSEYWYPLNGKLDDIRVYARALNSSEVANIYNSENGGISLTSSIKFGGGKTTLNVGTGYSFTASIKNNDPTSWVGNVYYKVNSGTPVLISSNSVIGAGGTYNVNTNFSPQTSQVGQNVSIELLTKQGSNSYVRIGTVNGTTNPVKVNIEAASSVPINKKPFINLNKSSASPNEVVRVTGGDFKPGTIVKLGYTPFTAGVTFPQQIVGTDGSILFDFTIPSTFTANFITFLVNDVDNYNQTASMVVNQVVVPTSIQVLNPNLGQASGGYINIGFGVEYLWIDWKDKLLKSPNYNLIGSKREFDYKIDFIKSDGTVIPIKLNYTGSELLNSEQTFKYYLENDDLFWKFGNGNSSVNTIAGKFKITDNKNTSRTAFSETLNIRWSVGSNGIQLSKEWDGGQIVYDKDGYTKPNFANKIQGIAADGVARFYYKLDFSTLTNVPQIQKVELVLIDPDNSTNTDATWMGKVMLATQSLVGSYSQEANTALATTVTTFVIPSNNQLYFWYVAPDDFQKDGKNYQNSIGRNIKVAIKVYFQGQSQPTTVEDNLWIVRPPLMMVHGWMGDITSFSKMDDNQILKPWLLKQKNEMNEYSSFDENSKILLDGVNQKNSFNSLINEMRREGIVSNQVDYVCHSMGGLMLRNILSKKDDDSMERLFFQTDLSKQYPLKNYQKGWVHKYITINTPHFGSPGADLIAGVLENGGSVITNTIKRLEIAASRYNSGNNIFPGIGTYKFKNGQYKYVPSDAVINMQTNEYSGGRTNFKVLNKVKSHAIYSDVDFGNTILPSNTNLLNPNSFYNRLYSGLINEFDVDLKKSAIFFVGYAIAKNLTTVSFTNQNLFSDFVSNNKDDLNSFWNLYIGGNYNPANLGLNSIIGTTPLGLSALTNTMQLWGGYNVKYADFLWNSDIIVPSFSQTSGLPLDSPNVTLIQNSQQVDMSNFHVGIQSKQSTIDRVFQLLNSSIHSPLFGNLEGNNNFQKTLTSNSSTSIIASLGSTPKILDVNPKEVYDKAKINIVSPTPNYAFNSSEILSIKVAALDTVNLKRLELILGKDVLVSDTTLTEYNFSYSGSNFELNGKSQIMAVGYYLINNEIYTKLDTISITTFIDQSPIGFQASPEIFNIDLDEKFTPNYLVLYPSTLSFNYDAAKLNIAISNTSCLEYNTQAKQFRGKSKGESTVIFTYDGIFKDTIYVAVAGGGIAYAQQIVTSTISTPSVCTGGTLSVPFVSSGGFFDANNQFIVQLSTDNGLNYSNLETIGNISPLSAKIPNSLVVGNGYKIRVISTNVPVLGSTSTTNISVTSFSSPPIVSANKSEFKLGESVILTATGCANIIKWNNGQTGSSITVTPTESNTYKATCSNSTCESADSQPIIINKYLCETNVVRNTSVTGNFTQEAGIKIESTEKIQGVGSRINYAAPSTELKAGFETQTGVIFQVLVGGCN
jgi:triacylglycerol esterase/lipase EstA (alpha/beta hydrolase family)